MENEPKLNKPAQVAPTVVDGFIKPGFPAKVYTCLFFESCVAFCKTGSIAPNTSGSMRAFLGGSTGDAQILGAIGAIFDSFTRRKRVEKAAMVSSFEPHDILAAHKRNFILYYDTISRVELKGPNFAGEVRVRFYTPQKTYKLRLDNQSKSSFNYINEIFKKFLGNKM
jgi:hypothetical protein